MITLRLRRGLVLIAVIASLVLGVATVRGAADWTAASAPLSVSPISVQELSKRLSDEQARSADLQRRLDELAATSTDLASAVDAANSRITTDAAAAAALDRRLAQARARLKVLEASIARAGSAGGGARPQHPTPSGGTGSVAEHESESDG